MIFNGQHFLTANQIYTTASNVVDDFAFESWMLSIIATNDLDIFTGLSSAVDSETTELVVVTNISPSNRLLLSINNSNSKYGNRIYTANENNVLLLPGRSVLLRYITDEDNLKTGWWVIAPPTTLYYDNSGLIPQQIKKWHQIVTPNTAEGYSINISSAGFNSILGINATAKLDTIDETLAPIVVIKNYNTTSVTINIIKSKNTVVGALGGVVDGLEFVSDLSGIEVFLEVTGY